MHDINNLRSSFLSDPDVIAVREAFRLALYDLDQPLSDAGQSILDKISAPNWTLEWFLPRWLGNSFGLSPDVIRALTLSNVLGLAFLRLVDDQVDGENQVADSVTTVSLATRLYHLAFQPYRELMMDLPQFWDQAGKYLAQWTNAIFASTRPPQESLRDFSQDHYQLLAQLGAPLKICCLAAWSLSNQQLDLQNLLLSIDHYVIGAVLLDHYKDWQNDLHAHRHNLFVNHVLQGDKTLLTQDELQSLVQEAFLRVEVLDSYFSIILKQVQTAQAYASKVRCNELEQHLHSFHQQIALHADGLIQSIEDVIRLAGQKVFGHASSSTPNLISK
ncbi:MAG: hypothetical protein JSV37_06745 [Anaerolineaceae bacterium]|nr:MAG: hypothetical protein JSV37_06745 [Anaerolineaceae bacterium]